MWTPFLRLLALSLQVPSCFPSCILQGLKASCVGQNLHWVPVLPPNITHLYLEMNSISEINISSLRSFRELQELNLEQQKVILTIKNSAFLRQRKLTRLFLGSNSGLRLEPRAFAMLSNLKDLSLYYCGLNDSILSERYLEPLLSLETLDLFGNGVVRLRPGLFFSRFTKFHQLDLTLNPIQTICEEDLIGFRGKYFTLLNLKSNKLLSEPDSGSCGNPFRGMAFDTLDLSSLGLNANKTRILFKSMEGTSISQLIYSGMLGKGFSHSNLMDPDENTFEGLGNSGVSHLVLSKSRIFTLHKAVFRHLKEAVIIDVSQNHINQIKKNAFDGLQGHLRLLNLSFNFLGEIYSHTFTSLTDLRVLDLSYNHIGVLGYSSFSGLIRLRALHMTGNSLKRLGFPVSLPNLEYLLLGSNNLESLYNIAHLGANSLHVDVSNNKLSNLEDFYIAVNHFERLQNFFFGSNDIKWCTLNQGITIPRNNSLLVLDLHSSSLEVVWEQETCLDLFDNLHHLLGLNISFNSLSVLPLGIFRGLVSIHEIDLSSNALTYLQADIFPASLRVLHLENNFLATPNPETFRSLTFVDLSENRFHCDCNLENFLMWMNATNVTFLGPLLQYRCEFPDPVRDLPLLRYSSSVESCDDDNEPFLQDVKFALFVSSALLNVGAVLAGVVYTHLRGRIFIVYKTVISRVLEGPKPTPPAGQTKYDAFLCFSNNDYKWVEAALLQKLDKQFAEENIFHCCFEARDFLPGEDHLSNIRDAIWSSRKTLCVVSQEFLKDGWCLEGFTLAQGRMLEELTNVLVVVVVGKVAHYQLMKCNAIRAFVRRREYLTFPENPQDLEWFYERLVSQMLKDTKVKTFAEKRPKGAEPGTEDAIQLEKIS